MIIDILLKLTKSLYPKGRAFKAPSGSELEKFYEAFNLSEERALMDALSILDTILPDNDNFTEDDAEQWERRLGIITGVGVSLNDRKLAIRRKMNHPGSIKARQNWRYIESQLQLAGFNVFIFENRFPDGFGSFETKTPAEIGIGLSGAPQMGDIQMGDAQMGGVFSNKIVNYIDENRDAIFNEGDNLRSTFFVSDDPLGTFADVPLNRKNEFRQLLLTLKPVQTVGYLLINYT